MKKLSLRNTLCALCVSLAATSGAQEQFYHFTDSVVNSTAMSPNGKLAVGFKYASMVYGNDWETGLSSYVWNFEDNSLNWVTIADINQLDKSGKFLDVNDDGMIVGYYKDEESCITQNVFGVPSTLPIHTAALWKDGQLVNLGLGDDLDIDNCNHFTDGSVATAISNNGKIIGGKYIMRSNAYPCVWTVDEEGNWNYKALALTAEDGTVAVRGAVNDISADGKVIAGEVYVNSTKSTMPAYWLDGKLYIINPTEEDKDLGGRHILCRARSVSPNGKYISVQFKKKFHAIYSVDEQKYKRFPMPDGSKNVLEAPINDNGDAICTYECMNSISGNIYHAVRSSYSTGASVDLSYVMKILAPDLDLPFSFDIQEQPMACVMSYTNDGYMLGNYNFSTWAIKVNGRDFSIPVIPEGLKGKLTNVSEVELSWPAVKDDNFQLLNYNIYQDGKLVKKVDYEEGKDVYTCVLDNVSLGYRVFTLSADYKLSETKSIESPKSKLVEVCVPGSLRETIFDDMEFGWNNNFWTLKDDVHEDNIDHIWGCVPYKGFISVAGVTVPNLFGGEYSLSAISRPLDGTNLKGNINLAFAIRKRMLNIDLKDLTEEDYTRDTLSIEISTDWGDTWQEIKSYTAKDIPDTYTFESVNLNEKAAGNIYRLRLRSHGQGYCEAQYLLDQISVDYETDYQAQGLMYADGEDNGRKLWWKNDMNAYSLTYMNNPYGDAAGMTVGNLGEPVIGANLYDPEMLVPFDGKYITAVTTSLNWYNADTNPEMDASIMIWEGDELVREQSFDVMNCNKFIVVPLETPLKINADKPLRVGVRVANYPVDEMPLLYFRNENFVTTRSDIYSEDEGKTWLTLKDAYADEKFPEDGHATWKIIANITDEETIDTDGTFIEDIVGYNVYRNGEKINGEMIYALQNKFVDTDAPATADYQVRGYYLSGGLTQNSEPLSIIATGISSSEFDAEGVVYDEATKTITISGKFDSATVYTLDGMKIAQTTESSIQLDNLGEGVYIVKVMLGGKADTYKLMLK